MTTLTPILLWIILLCIPIILAADMLYSAYQGRRALKLANACHLCAQGVVHQHRKDGTATHEPPSLNDLSGYALCSHCAAVTTLNPGEEIPEFCPHCDLNSNEYSWIHAIYLDQETCGHQQDQRRDELDRMANHTNVSDAITDLTMARETEGLED